jgi:hypothetical protein
MVLAGATDMQYRVCRATSTKIGKKNKNNLGLAGKYRDSYLCFFYLQYLCFLSLPRVEPPRRPLHSLASAALARPMARDANDVQLPPAAAGVGTFSKD